MSAGDEYSEIYKKFSDKIFRYLYWQTKDFRLSEDLTSEAFVKLWQEWKRIKRDFLQAWLFKVAHNLLVDWYRKKKEVSLGGYEVAYDDDLLERISKDEEAKKLGKALNALPGNLKRIAILRFIEGLSAKEVATILDLSEVNVRVLQHRALVKLKEVIKDGQG